MPLAMMKHLEEDVPPVFMILDTYDKDVKVDNISNWNVEPLIFCIHFLNTIHFMFSSVSLVNTFLSRLRCLLIYLWHLYIQLFLPHFSSGFRMNFVSFPDMFFLSRTFFLAPISSVYMETIGSSLSGILAQSSSTPTWTCQVHPSLPGGSSSGHWLRYNDQVHRRKVGKQEKRAWNLPGVASAKSLGSKLFPLLHILLAVRILWDKEEIRCCQGETWERCERNHRTDSGLSLYLK